MQVEMEAVVAVLAVIMALRPLHHQLKQIPRTKLSMEQVAEPLRVLVLAVAAVQVVAEVTALAVLRELVV
jgi:hypothetical protein